MKINNSKKDRILFVFEVVKHLKGMGAKETPSRIEGIREFNLATKTDNLAITVRSEEDHRHVYSVFARFNFTNRLTGRFNSKYNFHRCDVIGSVLADFDHYIKEGILI